MGEAMDELLGEDVDDEDLDMIRLLLKQKAPDRVVVDALARMRDVWLGEVVSDFFARLTEGDKPPPVIFCQMVAQAVCAVRILLCGGCRFSIEATRLFRGSIRGLRNNCNVPCLSVVLCFACCVLRVVCCVLCVISLLALPGCGCVSEDVHSCAVCGAGWRRLLSATGA
jgi:hypothetical protein